MNNPTIIPTAKQYEAWKALSKEDECKYPVFGGGAGGGKSWLGAEWLLTNCYFFPGSRWFIGREELSRLKKSTYITFRKVCTYHNIPADDWKFNGQDNYIEFKNGSRIDLLDLAYLPRDPLYERYGSSEYSGGWIEEGGEVNFLAFDVLKSRIGRHMNKEMDIPIKMLITCNPKKNWLYKYVYKPWKEGTLEADFKFIQSLYKDNPHTVEEYGEQLQSIKDKSTKERLMYGNWEYDDDPNTLINFEAIIDLFTNTVEFSEDKYMTVDVARYGQDKTVFMFWKGYEMYDVKTHTKQGINTTTAQARDYASKERIPYSHIVIDEDGVGGGLVDALEGVNGFVNNSSPILTDEQKDAEIKLNYQHLKAQCYYLLAEHINAHKIAVKTEDVNVKEQLTEELEYVKSKDTDKDGKLKVLSKEEIKELIGRSPDYADALMMRMYFSIKPATNKLSKPRQYKPKFSTQ